ncbi:hypothetical protein LPJ73_007025 [Coemansia sp. RSA 2703]|nr:hypothetical protein LPJ73_007025 [Coemansia sp. RSA 2703]
MQCAVGEQPGGMPQASEIAHGIVRALQALETAPGFDSCISASSFDCTLPDPGSVQFVARARAVDQLFCMPGDRDLPRVYGAVVGALADWCLLCNGRLRKSGVREVLARAIALGVPRVVNAMHALVDE